MATASSLAAAEPHALFEALLSGDEARALGLLQSSGAGQLLHDGPGGLTTLHAAVVGRCTAALPALVLRSGGAAGRCPGGLG